MKFDYHEWVTRRRSARKYTPGEHAVYIAPSLAGLALCAATVIWATETSSKHSCAEIRSQSSTDASN